MSFQKMRLGAVIQPNHEPLCGSTAVVLDSVRVTGQDTRLATRRDLVWPLGHTICFTRPCWAGRISPRPVHKFFGFATNLAVFGQAETIWPNWATWLRLPLIWADHPPSARTPSLRRTARVHCPKWSWFLFSGYVNDFIIGSGLKWDAPQHDSRPCGKRATFTNSSTNCAENSVFRFLGFLVVALFIAGVNFFSQLSFPLKTIGSSLQLQAGQQVALDGG